MRTLFRPLFVALLAAASAPHARAQAHWPQWRGPLGTGESKEAHPPLTWSATENVRWKAAIPGAGKATPIVWGDLVFVVSAEGVGEEVAPPEDAGAGSRGMRGIAPTRKQRFLVMALRRSDGSVAWKSVANEVLPHEGTHGDGSWAACSPVTDGERLIVSFGSRGIFAYDLAGKKLWEKQLGQMKTRNAFGEGSSPALHGDTVVVQWDHEGPSFVVALSAATGEEKWRCERDEPTSWATPLVVEVGGRAQVVTNGSKKVRAYDLETGELVWECEGMTANAIPTPVEAGGLAYVTTGFKGSALLAVRLAGAKGDLANTESIAWRLDHDTPYVPSPLLAGGRVFVYKTNSGILSAFDAKSGEAVFGPERLPSVSNVYASPVAADGRLYLTGRDGEVEVRELGGSCKLLATNAIDDHFDASPALAEGELYLRGAESLYCIAETAE